MSDRIEIRKETVNLRNLQKETVLETHDTARAQNKRTPTAMLMMAIWCATPLLLLFAIRFLGLTSGSFVAVGSSLLSIVALLACSIGMYLMMRMIMTGKK